jgi:hypothetical protein
MFFLKTSEQTLSRSRFNLPTKTIWLVAVIFSLVPTAPCFAQYRDDFESGATRWRLWRDDAGSRVLQNQRTQTVPHSGSASEMIEVTSGLQGTYIHLEYPLNERLAVIDELRCSFWVRAAVSGMRPALRVVFPRTAHPATHEPLTTLLIGGPSTGGGEWSQVEIRRPIDLLEAQHRVLKAQYGPTVDLREAYVDAVVLDVYNGPGNTKLQIDDLIIDGIVPIEMNRSQLPVPPARLGSVESDQELSESIAARARDLRASVPRWFQYRGESLDWLASIGINGLIVDQAPPVDFLNQAERFRMAVIAPPPALLPSESELPAWDAIQGWSLGWALDHSHLEAARESTIRLNRLPNALRKPTLVEPMEAYGPYARLADLVAVPVPLSTTIRDHDEAELLLKQEIQNLRGRTLPITSLMLEPIAQWRQQRDSLAQAIGSNAEMIQAYDRGQARLQLLRSMGHGARGWYFRSLSPLDSDDQSNQARIESLQALNAEIRLLSPWLQSGEPATKIAVDLSTGYVGYRIAMPRSQLIMLIARGDSDQLVVPSSNLPILSFKLARTQQTAQIYRISRGRLESLVAKPSPDGWNVEIPNPSTAELLVVTEDPRAIRYLQTTLAEISPQISESRLAIADQSLQLAQMTLVAEQVPDRDPAWAQVRLSESSLRGAEQFLTRGDAIRSVANADAAASIADQIIFQSWQRARIRFSSTNSSPLIASRLSLPLHWELDRIIRNRTWEPRKIPQGDLDDLNKMVSEGWTIDRRLEDRVNSQPSIASDAGPDRSNALQIDASSIDRNPIPGGYAGASLHISSPKIDVPNHSLIHFEGLVRVIGGAIDPQSGLLAYDDEGGPALGQLINAQTGDASTWQHINLYRFHTQNEGVRLHLEIRGSARVLVDQLRVEFLMPKPVSSFPTRPISTDQP